MMIAVNDDTTIRAFALKCFDPVRQRTQWISPNTEEELKGAS